MSRHRPGSSGSSRWKYVVGGTLAVTLAALAGLAVLTTGGPPPAVRGQAAAAAPPAQPPAPSSDAPGATPGASPSAKPRPSTGPSRPAPASRGQSRNFSVTFERFGGGWQPPQGHPHRRGHRHTVQEEVYFLVSGRAQGKFDGEVVDIAPWTAVRVPPETVRSFRAAGEEDAVFVTIGAPQAGPDDVEFIPDYWTD